MLSNSLPNASLVATMQMRMLKQHFVAFLTAVICAYTNMYVQKQRTKRWSYN